MKNIAEESCKHPKLYSGFVLNPDSGAMVKDENHMWVACCKCGEVIRTAPVLK
jgi:hypothetical protein